MKTKKGNIFSFWFGLSFAVGVIFAITAVGMSFFASIICGNKIIGELNLILFGALSVAFFVSAALSIVYFLLFVRNY